MLIPVLLFIVGLLCLIKGGDWFVDGATGIARRFHVPELLIGATVVSIGTTLPEVMVSTTSALTGHGEIAYGNAIGSVICNAALIAAITIAVRPGKVDPKSLRTPVAFFFVAAAFSAGVAYTTGSFTRPVGIILLAMFVAYMVANVLQMKKAPAAAEAEAEHEEEPAGEPAAEEKPAEETTDFPVLGEDIFAEFEKKKQQILNFDIGEQPESERRSKFAGLKFGNDFNLMDDEDDDFLLKLKQSAACG